MPTFNHFLNRNKRLIFWIFFLFLYAGSIAYAVPPTTYYQAGETLDPTCAPGDTKCSVLIIPDQTGNSGKYLTTDGSETSWGVVTSGVVWGAVTGTLSDQTDLQNALNAKQATLVSATNIKTVNGTTLLGSGDLTLALGTTETASNGLTKTVNDIALGGTLTGNTTIATVAQTLTISTSTAATIPLIVTSGTGTAMTASSSNTNYTINSTNSSSGYGLRGSSTSGTGVYGQGPVKGVFGVSSGASPAAGVYGWDTSTGYGVIGQSGNGIAGYFTTGYFSTGNVLPVIVLERTSGGIITDDTGISIDMQISATNGSVATANTIISKWTDATFGSRTSEFSITGVNNTVTSTLLTLSGSGATKLNNYGVGTFTGTPTYTLQVDSSGNIIEEAVGGGINTLDEVLNAGDSATGKEINITSGSINVIGGAINSENASINAYNTGFINVVALDAFNGNITIKTGGTYATISATNVISTDKALELPNASGILALSVNGNYADASGDITIAVGGLSDADYGDITVSSSGTVWGIDSSTVALGDLLTQGTATDEYCLTSETGGGALLAWQSCGGSSQWTTTGSDIYYNSGNVGIGDTTPTADLTIQKTLNPLGTELVTNGTFTGSASGWTLEDCASYGSNEVTVLYTACTEPSISTSIAIESGKTYSITFTVSSATSPLFIYFDNIGSYSNQGPFGDGIHTVVFASDFTGTETIIFTNNSVDDAGWTLDNVSIKEVTDINPTILGLDYNGDNTFSFGNMSGDNFLGTKAGNGATNVVDSNFFGSYSGMNATNASSSNFLGYFSGGEATNAAYSNFFGFSAGQSATNAHNSNFFGVNSGANAIDADNSNFFGGNAGANATSAGLSNFFGGNAGANATNASFSNFFGFYSGENATNAYNSNFFGGNAGTSATDAFYSNFLGYTAGIGATNANNSNFFGQQAGASAVNAYQSTFLGFLTGSGATNAANSIFIGQNAGYHDTVDNTAAYDSASTWADTSILIGAYTSTAGYENSIAIGAYATNTASNQFMIGSTTRNINEVVIKGSGTCSIVATGISCSSDERLKTNIEDLPMHTLDTLINVRTVLYNWNSDPDGDKTIGFLAQDLEQYYPQLVRTDSDGFKMVNYAQMTPILTQAIRELDLKITDIENLLPGADGNISFADRLIAWLANAENHITRIFTGEICLTDPDGTSECVNKTELGQLKNLLQANSVGSIPPPASDPVPETLADVPVQTDTPPSVDTPPSDIPPAPSSELSPSESASESTDTSVSIPDPVI